MQVAFLKPYGCCSTASDAPGSARPECRGLGTAKGGLGLENTGRGPWSVVQGPDGAGQRGAGSNEI